MAVLLLFVAGPGIEPGSEGYAYLLQFSLLKLLLDLGSGLYLHLSSFEVKMLVI